MRKYPGGLVNLSLFKCTQLSGLQYNMANIFFDTKENNNRRREVAFLQLTPDERFQTLLKMVDEFSKFTTAKPKIKKENFVLEKTSKVEQLFDNNVRTFLELAYQKKVRMLMVGGGAVNFHGYQRHSADVDFWIDVSEENLQKMIQVLNEMGYEIEKFPPEIHQAIQNVSIKISPAIEIELITKFNPGKSFDLAFKDAVQVDLAGIPTLKYYVLNYEDLINSKIKAGRPKDLLDIQELKRINKK